MKNIADFGVREIVLEDERFVLYRARDPAGADVLLKMARAGATADALTAFWSDLKPRVV